MAINLHFNIKHVDVHVKDDEQLKQILEQLDIIKKQNQKLMALTEQQFDEVFAKIDTNTTRIADRIRALEEAVKAEGLSAEAEARILAKTSGIADALEAIGKDPETPTPEIPADPNTPIPTPE